ncbi:unnamed protein product [Staurois parvus]|uniref:Uncharacterized protein n=1 Tax=Staurois parvus TaxID=386267 RepID=A0ABN9G1T8_9NEOB|nr:unnamed protein product [Staurois parvus]
MHSPKKKNSSNTHQTEHVQLSPDPLFYQEIFRRHCKKGRIREDRIKHSFYTMWRIGLLGSTVSITSMLYCIYRLILLLWV